MEKKRTIQKAIKFRIYPNKIQKEYFDECFRINKFIYNYFLGEQKEIDLFLKASGIGSQEDIGRIKREHNLYFNKLGKKGYKSPYNIIKEMSEEKNYSFLKKFPSSAIYYSLTSLDNAFKNMRKTNAGFPNFKKDHSIGSYTIQKTSKQTLKIERKDTNKKWGKITISIPGFLNRELKKKLKNIKINLGKGKDSFLNNLNNENFFKINSYTISKDSKKDYWISIQVDQYIDDVSKKDLKNCDIVGIDMGVTRPVTTSIEDDFNNELYSNKIQFIKNTKEKVEKIQQSLARKRRFNKDWKNSKKYKREKQKLSKLYKKISNQRKAIQHNISRKLVDNKESDILAFEKLNIKGMTKRSGKGKSNNKKGLTKSILDVGIFEIQRQTEYKSEWSGKRVIKVDPKNTSIKCSECGHTDKENRKEQAKFKCVKCEHKENADSNASKNIQIKAENLIEEKGEKAFLS